MSFATRRFLESDPAFAAGFRAAVAEGLGPRAVARRLGIAPSTAYGVRRRLGLDPSASPRCSECLTPDGYTMPGDSRPVRRDATPFGGKAGVCQSCYDKARRPVPASPCCRCGTLGGYTTPGCRRPRRYRIAWEGRMARACRSCFDATRAVRPDPAVDVPPAAVMADSLAEMAGKPLVFRPDGRDEAGGTWHAVAPLPSPGDPVAELRRAWLRDTRGGREWLGPWRRTMGVVGLGKVVEEEE